MDEPRAVANVMRTDGMSVTHHSCRWVPDGLEDVQLIVDNGELLATAASNADGPAAKQVAGLPKRRDTFTTEEMTPPC